MPHFSFILVRHLVNFWRAFCYPEGLPDILSLKVHCQEMFFHQSTFIKALIHWLKSFQKKFWYCQYIVEKWMFAGVNETVEKCKQKLEVDKSLFFVSKVSLKLQELILQTF
jgi:hypothetical protein